MRSRTKWYALSSEEERRGGRFLLGDIGEEKAALSSE